MMVWHSHSRFWLLMHFLSPSCCCRHLKDNKIAFSNTFVIQNFKLFSYNLLKIDIQPPLLPCFDIYAKCYSCLNDNCQKSLWHISLNRILAIIGYIMRVLTIFKINGHRISSYSYHFFINELDNCINDCNNWKTIFYLILQNVIVGLHQFS